jgi:NitT/TauT family transport system permease protein
VRSLAVRCAILLLAASAYEAVARASLLGPTLSVPPSRMATTLLRLLATGRLGDDLSRTATEVGLGFAGGALLGVALGILLWRIPLAAAAIEPYLLAYYAVPLFALYPLFIKMMGAGLTPIVAIGALAAVGAVATNTLIGLRSVPRVLLAVGASLRLTRPQMVVHVIIPAAVPHLFVGLRLGFIYALIGVLASEFILATAGLGYLISYDYNNFESASMFATILLVATASMAINWLLALGERRLNRYRRSP